MVTAGIGLLILAAAVSWLVVTTDRRLRDVARDQRLLHLQQATIIAMLMRAGFRRPSAGPDWGDSGHMTKVAGKSQSAQ